VLGTFPGIDVVSLKTFCRNFLQHRHRTEQVNITGSFLLDIVQRWIDCQRCELWKEEDIGSTSWKCTLSNHTTGISHNAAMEYVCHVFVSWFSGAKCAHEDPYRATEDLLRSKDLDSWKKCVSSNSLTLQKIMVGSLAPKGKQDLMCLRANDKKIIYLLTHVILPATGYSMSHTTRLGGFTPGFLQDIHKILAAVFSIMNLKHECGWCDHHGVHLYTSRNATWAKEEEVFLEVMISLIFLYRFSSPLYGLTTEFRKTVHTLRHTYECSFNTIAKLTETAEIKYHWLAADQDLHTIVLRYMFLEAAEFVPL
jgi:hypothetical protein